MSKLSLCFEALLNVKVLVVLSGQHQRVCFVCSSCPGWHFLLVRVKDCEKGSETCGIFSQRLRHKAEFWFRAFSFKGYAFGDVSATLLQSTVSLCWGVGLAPCLFLFHNVLALGSLLCFHTKQTWLRFSSGSKKKECCDSPKFQRALNTFFITFSIT